MLKTPTSNTSFNPREKSFFQYLEEEMMKKTKMSKSGGYKQALLAYHSKLTESAVIR
ncbi:hypothetical protein [Prochlorococcus sp. MIT 1306]|uniref:hypothetical protein n=1 Tax=Prochlorococcus sp. MIT 1306 TaxID=1799667 RepID=UPI000A4999E4